MERWRTFVLLQMNVLCIKMKNLVDGPFQIYNNNKTSIYREDTFDPKNYVQGVQDSTITY